MSDIVINNDHCALILSKEEAVLVFALVGKMTNVYISAASNIYNTIRDSGFVSRDEFYAWWDKHALIAMVNLNCKVGETIQQYAVILGKK